MADRNVKSWLVFVGVPALIYVIKYNHVSSSAAKERWTYSS